MNTNQPAKWLNIMETDVQNPQGLTPLNVDGAAHQQAVRWVSTALGMQLGVSVVARLASMWLFERLLEDMGTDQWHRILGLVSNVSFVLTLGCMVALVYGIHLWARAHINTPVGQRLLWARNAEAAETVLALLNLVLPNLVEWFGESLSTGYSLLSWISVLVFITAQGLLYYAIHALVVMRAPGCLPAFKASVILFVASEVVSMALMAVTSEITQTAAFRLGSGVLRMLLSVACTVMLLSVLKRLRVISVEAQTADSGITAPGGTSLWMADMVVGGVVAGMGVIITVWSYQAAPGGRVVIAYFYCDRQGSLNCVDLEAETGAP